jgi:hypothetical protein
VKAGISQQIVAMIEAEAQFHPSWFDFEIAYQARVAMDRIRFAIRATENADGKAEQLREVTLQLLDALDRLGPADRNFQCRFRTTGNEPQFPVERERVADDKEVGFMAMFFALTCASELSPFRGFDLSFRPPVELSLVAQQSKFRPIGIRCARNEPYRARWRGMHGP